MTVSDLECTTINLSILDFKWTAMIAIKCYALPINLSILDFKCRGSALSWAIIFSINLSILDFKSHLLVAL